MGMKQPEFSNDCKPCFTTEEIVTDIKNFKIIKNGKENSIKNLPTGYQSLITNGRHAIVGDEPSKRRNRFRLFTRGFNSLVLLCVSSYCALHCQKKQMGNW
jgi:hypothetical protein